MTQRLKLISILILAVVSFGCLSSDKSVTSGEELTIEDGYKVNDSNEIVIDDNAFAGKNQAVAKTTQSSEEGTKTGADKSQITTMNDGHGNITETRNFPDTAPIRMLIVRRTADGRKQVFVYGQDAAVKELPPEMQGKALTASADEIADSVKMYGGKIVKLRPIIQSTPLRPMPSSQFPVTKRQAQIAEISKSDTPATSPNEP